MTTAPAGTVAAVVRGRPITVAEVDERLARLRGGAFGAQLPGRWTAEGRNARRWVVQLLCAEHIVRDELTSRGLTPSATARPIQIARALGVGGVAAAVLAIHPDVAELAGAPAVEEADVRGYYDRNPDLFADRDLDYPAVRTTIADELARANADRAFADWLERRMAVDVRLTSGFEHPAEPGHPDSTHRH